MQSYDELDDNKGIGIPEVYSLAISTDSEHDKRPMSAQEFIQEQAKNTNSLQAISTVGLPGATFSYNGNVFLVRTGPSMGHYRKLFLHLYNSAYYITRNIQQTRDILVKSVCTTLWDANNNDHIR